MSSTEVGANYIKQRSAYPKFFYLSAEDVMTHFVECFTEVKVTYISKIFDRSYLTNHEEIEVGEQPIVC